MVSKGPEVKKYVQTMVTYPVSDVTTHGSRVLINLASNENTMPPSDAVQQVFIEAMSSVNRYSNNACTKVIDELAVMHTIDPEKLVCGNGSSELIFLLAEAFVSAGDEVVIWKHGYLLYETAARRLGAFIVRAASSQFMDVNALLHAVTARTKLVYIDNPNNPSGAYISMDELRYLRQHLREDILLVIDAAYAEYVVAEDYDCGQRLVDEYDNVCMLRSFSKMYGLAGARLGWMYAPREVVTAIRILQQPSSTSMVAQQAAIVAMREPERIVHICHQNQYLRKQFIDQCITFGLNPHSSQANFVLVDFLSEHVACHVFSELKRQGILVRPMTAYNLKRYLRFTIGISQEMDTLYAVLFKIITK